MCIASPLCNDPHVLYKFPILFELLIHLNNVRPCFSKKEQHWRLRKFARGTFTIIGVTEQNKLNLSRWIISQRQWILRYQFSTTYIGTEARKEYFAHSCVTSFNYYWFPRGFDSGFVTTSGIQVTNKITILVPLDSSISVFRQHPPDLTSERHPLKQGTVAPRSSSLPP